MTMKKTIVSYEMNEDGKSGYVFVRNYTRVVGSDFAKWDGPRRLVGHILRTASDCAPDCDQLCYRTHLGWLSVTYRTFQEASDALTNRV